MKDFSSTNRRKQGISNLQNLTSIFTNSFLTYGSALGAIREQDIIKHDRDTDIGLFKEDFTWSMIDWALDDGFRLLRIFGQYEHGMELAFYKNRIKTDVWLFYKKDKHTYNCLWDGQKEIKHTYPNDIFNIELHKLGDILFKCPGKSYIEHIYGEHWQQPQKKFDWRTDHKCIETGSNFIK